MKDYLTIEQAAAYLGVSIETIKRYVEKGELPVYKLERALRVLSEDLDSLLDLQVVLTPGLRAVVKHSCQTAPGSDAWRIIISFEDTTKEKRLISPFGPNNEYTEYYIWVSKEYLDDHARLPGNIKGAEKFALQLVQEEFEKTKDESGDRSITKIKHNKVVAAYGMLRYGVHLNSPITYKNYSIRFTTEGFKDMLPNVFGKVVVFLVDSEKDHKTCYIAFAQSGTNEIAGDTEDTGHLIVKALDIIKESIDNDSLENKKSYTYEYKFHQFNETENPDWWTKVLASVYRL